MKAIKEIIKYGAVSIIFYFLFKSLYQNWSKIDFNQIHFNYLYLGVSIISMCCHFLFIVYGWRVILCNLGVSIKYLDALKVFSYSQLGKYLPGKIWVYWGRLYFCEKLGVSKKTALVSVILETGISALGGLMIFFGSLALYKFDVNINPVVLVAIFAVLLFGIYPPVFEKMVNCLLRILGRKPINIGLTFWQIIKLLGLYIVMWLCFGFTLFLLINSVTFLPFTKIPIVTGFFCVAVLLGMAALFSPGGVGVREGALSFLFANFFSVPVAIMLSLLIRIWMTVIELLIIGLVSRCGTGSKNLNMDIIKQNNG